LLGTCDLIAHEDHGDALAHHENCHRVLHLPATQGINFWSFGQSLPAAVPALVVVTAVVVVFPIGLVVLLVIGHQIGKGKAVVRRNEIDGSAGTAPPIEVW
jgi:hypothetical protein